MSDEVKIPLPSPSDDSNHSSNLPKLERPPEFLAGDQWYGTDISGDWLDFTKPYEKPKNTLSFQSIPFAPLGGIHALTGLSGNGKTWTFVQLMATFLSGSIGDLRYELGDIIPHPIVLYIDTEQEMDSTIAVKNRVCSLIGSNPQQARDDFFILCLRETETATDRWRKILQAIYQVKPTVVFIDGLLDVVADFNNNEQCAELVYKCMQVSSHYNASVWCLVHLNPNGSKLVGHLGSVLERKVTDVFATSKDSSKGDVVFTVSQKKARGRDVPEWKFRVLPESLWGRPKQILDTSTSYDDKISIESLEMWLREGKDDILWPAYCSDIMKIFKERGNINKNDVLQDCITRCKNRRFIIPQADDEREKGQRYPKFHLNI